MSTTNPAQAIDKTAKNLLDQIRARETGALVASARDFDLDALPTQLEQLYGRRDIDGMAVTGRTRHDLRGIRFAEGEGGNGPAGGDGAGGNGETLNGGAGDNAPWTKENFDPERAWRLTENLRTDLASQKTKTDAAIAAAAEKAKKDTLAEFAKLLGGEQAETDPAKLQQRVTELTSSITEKDTALTSAQAALKARDLNIAVLSNPAIRNANPKLLLAHKAFTDSIGQVDPTDEAAITAAINKALQDNAALKATPSRSGSGEHQGATVPSIEAQLAAAQKAGDKTETIRLKMELAAARRRAKRA